MSSSPYRVRRATLDDLGALRPMWEAMRFPVAELEKRLTEFQVAEDDGGAVLGGIGFRISNRQAQIHSEAYSDFSVAESVRPLLWGRLQTLAANYGIVRFWTHEDAPFWKQHGLQPAVPDDMKRLPPEWQHASVRWMTLPLKSEEAILSVDKEFAMFMAAEKQRTARAHQHARLIKYVATGLAIVFALFVAGAIFYLLRHNPNLLHLGG